MFSRRLEDHFVSTPLFIEWAGESLGLFAERAIWWPREKTLFIADLHLGKAATFRLAGIPVPETSHEEDLLRVSRLVKETGALRLVILGDLFHAKKGQTSHTSEALLKWRNTLPDLEIILVEGNHDRSAGRPYQGLGIQLVEGPWLLSPFVCCHEPQALDSGFVLAGHLHPKYSLSVGGESLTAACFHESSNLMVLPAFGSFTGGHAIRPKRGDRIYLAGTSEVIALPVISK